MHSPPVKRPYYILSWHFFMAKQPGLFFCYNSSVNEMFVNDMYFYTFIF